MTCRSCGAELFPGARFCASCGTAVDVRCGTCGNVVPDGARFCPSCGAPAGAAASGPDPSVGVRQPGPGRERKVATLLFADLVGFTSFGEAHDPEVVGALVGDVFARLGAEVRRYEGTIEKFAGDAMLAVFGVPAIHEDDPERAVRAALEMQAAMTELAVEMRARGRPEPQLRIGLESGEVLVDLARATAERDLFVTGDAVNTAARLQQAADPGTVVVGPGVYAATRHLIDYDELDPASLRGKAAPVAAWRAIAVKARRGGQRAPLGIEAPIVGRDAELALLKETLRRTVADGRPHLVTVVGNAGVGKSRLTWELEKYLDGLPETYHWRKGRCLAYAQASYSALADVVKADARITDDEAPAAAIAKLEARIGEVHGAGADASIAAALQAVLALGSGGAVAREDLFDAWRRHLGAVARVAPLVLVLEDIHWADEGLLDVIEYVARWGDGPIMILCLARHELLERRPAWGGGVPNASMIVLEPLEPAEASRLIDGLLGTALPADLRDRIVELSDGNPLFAEELVRMLVDRGDLRHTEAGWQLVRAVGEVEVPGTIQAVLAARLDGLPPAEKRLAQNAAVVGRIFWDAVLAHLARMRPGETGDLLRRLRIKELVVPREPSSLAGAAEFGFRHVLIRDVAYDSLPKRDRAGLHLEVAEWAEAALAERREEFVELLAAHYVAALHYEEEFGSDSAALRRLRERTVREAREAARRAYRVGELDAATRWIRTAVEQARKLDLPAGQFAALVQDYVEIGFANESGATRYPVMQEALDRLQAEPHPTPEQRETIGSLQAHAARALYLSQRPDDARRMLETALAAEPSSGVRAELLTMLGWVEWRLGRYQQAVPPLEEAVRLAEASGNEAVLRTAIHELAIALGWLNRPEAVPFVMRSFELAKAAGDANLLSRCYINVPSVLLYHGQHPEPILTLCEEGMRRARRRLEWMGLSWVGANYAETLMLLGRLGDARAIYEEAVDGSLRVGDPELIAMRKVGLATNLLWLGDRDAAAGVLDAETRTLAAGESQTVAWLLTVDLRLAWPDVDRAIDEVIAQLPLGQMGNGELLGITLARVGIRADRRDALEAGERLVRLATSGAGSPRMQLTATAAEALLDGSPAAVERLVGAADAMAAIGWRLPAAEILADASYLAARHGLDAMAIALRAQDAFAAIEAMPAFGDPVEAIAGAVVRAR